MWARVTTFQFPPDDVEHAETELRRGVERFGTRPGLERIDVYVNRRNGAALTVSLWHGDEEMRATADDAGVVREGVSLEVMGWVERVEEYEILQPR